MERQRIAALTVGIAVTLIGFYLVGSGYTIADWLAAILRGLNAWAWLIAILGFGSRYLNFSNRFLKYANEAVLPFYILHQAVILAIGYYIVRLHLPIAAKFFIIVTVSLLTILGLYDVLVKRINMLRFLFGMRLIPASRFST
jgi:peptidoglycan/LPS O-acetylase OafA/YrhL